MLQNRLRKKVKHLIKWAKRERFGAIRLYDRDIPEIPLVLDLYDGFLCGALYKRPYEKNPQEETLWLERMKKACAVSLDIPLEKIIIKEREKKRGNVQYEKRSEEHFSHVVTERDFSFKVNLKDYIDTGLFIDRRALRYFATKEVKGKTFLNLFCYTGSFSVYAAGFGAASTFSIDLSNTYLSWAHENFTLNGFAAQKKRLSLFFSDYKNYKNIIKTESQNYCYTSNGISNSLIQGDARKFVSEALTYKLCFDTIVLDPPAFSNSKMTREFFDLQRDAHSLLASCLSILAPEGKLFFSACARSYKATALDFQNVFANEFPGLSVVDITSSVTDKDFLRKKGPRAYLFTLPS
jgi:23S rRNA G2069 N7-methylase RlmK/C1962 C5-methylase RlmI